MFYVYILHTQKKGADKYIGLTEDLPKRVSQHRNGEVIATKGVLPITLIWYCASTNRHTAATFEKYLKSGSGRAFVNRHILGSGPGLSAEARH
jgi:predicted GIY-YIG superfamily endonuclease